jgi:hypothetical protein
MMKSILTVMCIALCLGVVGCEKDSVVEVEDLNSNDIESARDQVSPMNVLENIALAYRTRDSELYEEQLDPSFVVGFFEPQPAIGGGVVRGLTYEQNMTSVVELFADANSLTFEMKYEKPVPSEFSNYPGSEGYYQVNAHEVNLRIDSLRYNNVLAVVGGRAAYVLKNFGTVDRPHWKLVFQETH